MVQNITQVDRQVDCTCIEPAEILHNTLHNDIIVPIVTLLSLAQLLPPRSPTVSKSVYTLAVSNPVLDSSLCRPAAPRLCPLALQLLLPNCIHFTAACSPIASASSTAAPQLHLLELLLPSCVRFDCCSPIASASTAAPQLCLLRLLLPEKKS